MDAGTNVPLPGRVPLRTLAAIALLLGTQNGSDQRRRDASLWTGLLVLVLAWLGVPLLVAILCGVTGFAIGLVEAGFDDAVRLELHFGAWTGVSALAAPVAYVLGGSLRSLCTRPRRPTGALDLPILIAVAAIVIANAAEAIATEVAGGGTIRVIAAAHAALVATMALLATAGGVVGAFRRDEDAEGPATPPMGAPAP